MTAAETAIRRGIPNEDADRGGKSLGNIEVFKRMKKASSSAGDGKERPDRYDMDEPDEHRRFIRRIPDFFSDSLDESELDGFLRHYDSCSECRDEVAIQYLIHEGLSRVESGTAFNFEREMNEYVDTERTRLLGRERFTRFVFVLEAFTVAVFAAAVVLFVLNGFLF